MLVQKSALNQRTKIILIVLAVLVVAAGAYYYFTKIAKPAGNQNIVVSSETDVVRQTQIPKLDNSIFHNPQLFNLRKDSFAGFTGQYQAVSLSDKAPLPPKNISVVNSKLGQQLVVNWQLPEYINFHKVKVYRSESFGDQGEVIWQQDVSPDSASKLMSYQDNGLTNNKTYYYIVKTVIVSGAGEAKVEIESNLAESADKLPVSGRPTDEVGPEAPANVLAIGQPDGTIKISWLNPKNSDLARIRIYRSSEKGVLGLSFEPSAYEQMGLEDPDNKELRYYIDEQAYPNTVYYYTVTSVDASGNESSTDVLATPVRGPDYNPFDPIEFTD